jgi:ribosomal protein S12 methylthiotransferase
MMRRNLAETPLRVGLISLGCAKNLVDAEIMLGTLLKDGVQITNDPSQADVVIVNTCSFIDAAQQESVDAILQSDQVRQAANRNQGLIVAGCLPQRFRDQLPNLLPEVDAFMGIDQVTEVTRLVRQVRARRLQGQGHNKPAAQKRKKKFLGGLAEIERRDAGTGIGPSAVVVPPGETTRQKNSTLELDSAVANGGSNGSAKIEKGGRSLLEVHSRPHYIPDYATPRFRLTPRHFAYVKIAEGCNHPCSFCIIPQMRGSHRSRLQSDIVSEARALLADGVKELNLISQDSTY